MPFSPLQPPSTPPWRAHKDSPVTPATPRYGALDDMPDIVVKRDINHTLGSASSHKSHRKQVNSIHYAAQNSNNGLLATPRQTPRKRIIFPPPSTTPVRGSGRCYTHKKKPTLDESIRAQPVAVPASEPRHPHNSLPEGPGMWFVFRGKKVFRALPPGESRPEPVSLFPAAPLSRGIRKDHIHKRKARPPRPEEEEQASEADTDLEI